MTHTIIEWHNSMASAIARAQEPNEWILGAWVDFLGAEEYGARGHGWCVVALLDGPAEC